MKIKTLCLAAILSVCLTACSKEEERDAGRLIARISGSYSNSDSEQYKTFRYEFTYDSEERIASVAYTGDLYVYGDGLIRADYTYRIDRSGADPVVTLQTADPRFPLLSGWESYEGIPEEEVLPLVFDTRGNLTAIAGRELWFHVEDTALEYDNNGFLTAIREDDGAYYKTAVGMERSNGNLTSQTHNSLGYTGEVSFSTTRRFTYSDRANDYAVDLNWLTGDLGLQFQNGLTPLALLGLTGERSGSLVAAVTLSDDDTPWPVSYTIAGDRITAISREVRGSYYNYTLSYY